MKFLCIFFVGPVCFKVKTNRGSASRFIDEHNIKYILIIMKFFWFYWIFLAIFYSSLVSSTTKIMAQNLTAPFYPAQGKRLLQAPGYLS